MAAVCCVVVLVNERNSEPTSHRSRCDESAKTPHWRPGTVTTIKCHRRRPRSAVVKTILTHRRRPAPVAASRMPPRYAVVFVASCGTGWRSKRFSLLLFVQLWLNILFFNFFLPLIHDCCCNSTDRLARRLASTLRWPFVSHSRCTWITFLLLIFSFLFRFQFNFLIQVLDRFPRSAPFYTNKTKN